MIARLMPTALATSSIWASRTPRASNSSRVAAMIRASRSRRRSAAAERLWRPGAEGALFSDMRDIVRVCNSELQFSWGGSRPAFEDHDHLAARRLLVGDADRVDQPP